MVLKMVIWNSSTNELAIPLTPPAILPAPLDGEYSNLSIFIDFNKRRFKTKKLTHFS